MIIDDVIRICGLNPSWKGFLTKLSQQDYVKNLNKEEKTKLITRFACEILNREK